MFLQKYVLLLKLVYLSCKVLLIFMFLGIALWKQSCENGYDYTEKVSYFFNNKIVSIHIVYILWNWNIHFLLNASL